jgi:opacity protein-like surface antigen
MKNRLISLPLFLVISLLLSSSVSKAQQLDASWDLPAEKQTVQRIGDDVQDFEIGLGVGFATPLKIGYGIKFDAEARYNIVGTPWDLGLQYSALGVSSPKYGVKLNSSAMYSAHVDYNWRNWNNIAPFAGLGAGYYNGEYLNPSNALGHDGITVKASNAFISFRGGCEFWDHLRITAEYRLLFGGTPSVLSISVGWAFFGGHKK